MYFNPRRLLDQITLLHGPHDLLAQYFIAAEAAARACGVRLWLRTDFERLIELNERNRDNWPPLLPMFNPLHSNLRIDTAFWIEGLDEEGETVLTNAARLYEWPKTTLADELGSLRVFYEDPAPHLAAGEHIELRAQSATMVRGRVVFPGAMWVRPDYRRHGLTRIVPRITRSYAYTRWGNDMFWGLIEPKLHEGGVTRAYGPWNAEDGVMIHLASREVLMMILSANAGAMLADIAAIVGQATREISPLTDIPSTKRSFPEPYHGMSSRS